MKRMQDIFSYQDSKEINLKIKSFPGLNYDGNVLFCDYGFPEYLLGLKFAVLVGTISEELNHHPEILIQYKKVRISTFTHSHSGITNLDFELIEKVNSIFEKIS